MIQQLSQICDFLSGNAWKAAKFKEEGIPIIRINNMKPNSTDFKYWDWEEEYNPKYFIEEGDILVSLSGTIKIYKWVGVQALLNQRIVKVSPKENINIDWVYYQISNVIEKIADKGKDAVIKNVSVTDLKKYEVEVPDLPTQNKIVALLDKASALVQKREKSIAQLDELLRAQFLEMFGDPVLNPKGWEVKEISDFSNSRLGKMLDKKKMLGNNLKNYLGNSNVQWFKFDFKELKQMDFNEKDLITFKMNEGDILMCEGGDIGRCAIWKNEEENCFFQKALHRITLDNEVMLPNCFVYNFWLLSKGGGLDIYKGGATISHLTGVNLKKMKLPVPPIELQNKFETIYHNIQAQKENLIQSKTDLENLYNSLLQNAFKGELVVKKEDVKKRVDYA